MVLPGIYTKQEQQMLEQWDIVEREIGWLGDDPIPGKISHPVTNRVATKDLIINRAKSIHDSNPLWRDDKYARQTRWGSIIAPPFFELVISFQGPINFRAIPPEVGVARTMGSGAPEKNQSVIWTYLPHWEFFKPIRPGDSFRVWYGPNTHEDKTDPDGKGPRIFLLHDQLKYFNQKDELVAIKHKKNSYYIISPAVRKKTTPSIKSMPKLEPYKYSQDELDFIDHVRENEIIRGAQIHWWEDVNAGEDLQPVTNGPTNLWDQAIDITSLGTAPVEEKKGIPPHIPILDPETGIWHNSSETHLSDRVAQLQSFRQASTMMSLWEAVLGRLITNWMGDDGFLKKTAFDRLENDFLGDTIIGRGRVIKKYVQDSGEHVVDIHQGW
jgi:acyl dehydratase